MKNINFIDEKSIDTKYDLVIISTPHIDAKKIFFEYKNLSDTVLIEKPMGLTLKDAEEMHKISNDFRKIFVGFNYRFFPPIQKLRHDLLNNEFGDLFYINPMVRDIRMVIEDVYAKHYSETGNNDIDEEQIISALNDDQLHFYQLKMLLKKLNL